MIKDTSKQMAKVAVEALKEKKGYDVKVIDISEISIPCRLFHNCQRKQCQSGAGYG